ncbi:proteasome maturation protein [Exaiptasia diaphana]|uniref:Proteasome maturation factor UMP1 n=1 Tax=Exaiptasia diaphana TaxID=2652724 RepID=A0A913YAW9_EXADI|nr:proteasome maturation protein [Exaiptasia diaphana]KXJ19511.1 Proteasome maturation protein [Exaiptasia diaphana]
MADNMKSPTILPKSDGASEVTTTQGLYGVPDRLRTGLSNVKDQIKDSHPLEFTEMNYTKNQQALDMRMLRNTQGLHAPLRLQMECAVTSKIQRLPCLPSSMIALDTLMGSDDSIGFEDILGAPGDLETMGDIHSIMERKHGF